jgi:hypothetical protein
MNRKPTLTLDRMVDLIMIQMDDMDLMEMEQVEGAGTPQVCIHLQIPATLTLKPYPLETSVRRVTLRLGSSAGTVAAIVATDDKFRPVSNVVVLRFN